MGLPGDHCRYRTRRGHRRRRARRGKRAGLPQDPPSAETSHFSSKKVSKSHRSVIEKQPRAPKEPRTAPIDAKKTAAFKSATAACVDLCRKAENGTRRQTEHQEAERHAARPRAKKIGPIKLSPHYHFAHLKSATPLSPGTYRPPKTPEAPARTKTEGTRSYADGRTTIETNSHHGDSDASPLSQLLSQVAETLERKATATLRPYPSFHRRYLRRSNGTEEKDVEPGGLARALVETSREADQPIAGGTTGVENERRW